MHKPYTTTQNDLKFGLNYIHAQFQMSVGTSYSKGSSLALTENNSVEPTTTDYITGSAFHTYISHISMYIYCSAVKIKPRGTPQQLCSALVANMNR